jgi:hypothetical protein
MSANDPKRTSSRTHLSNSRPASRGPLRPGPDERVEVCVRHRSAPARCRHLAIDAREMQAIKAWRTALFCKTEPYRNTRSNTVREKQSRSLNPEWVQRSAWPINASTSSASDTCGTAMRDFTAPWLRGHAPTRAPMASERSYSIRTRPHAKPSTGS